MTNNISDAADQAAETIKQSGAAAQKIADATNANVDTVVQTSHHVAKAAKAISDSTAVVSDSAVESAKHVGAAANKFANDPTVQGKVIEMLDSLQHGAVHVGDKIVEYSPQVANAALWVVRIDGMQALLNGFIALIGCLLLFKWTRKGFKWFRDGLDDDSDSEETAGKFFVGLAVPVGLFFPFGIVVSNNLLNIWVWIQVIEPKLYLAKRIIDAVIK